MSYTRRSLLRDTALIAMARPYSIIAQPAPALVPPFSSGIRIFFAGAWLFVADPKPGYVRAVSVDPGGNLLHYFPHGVWDGATPAGTWDGGTGRSYLGTNFTAPSVAVTPHVVNVAGQWAAPSILAKLFNDANSNSRFNHIPNSSQYTFSINYPTPGIRVISLPIPTRIIPAAFRQGVKVTDNNNHMPPSTCTTSDKNGIPTSHIFEYQNADSMTLTPLGAGSGPAPTAIGQPGIGGDYHFHAIPQSFFNTHDIAMFKALFGLIQGTPSSSAVPPWTLDMALDTSGATGSVTKGALVPTVITPSELEALDSLSDAEKMNFIKKPGHAMVQESAAEIHFLVLASCCSGGAGVGS